MAPHIIIMQTVIPQQHMQDHSATVHQHMKEKTKSTLAGPTPYKAEAVPNAASWAADVAAVALAEAERLARVVEIEVPRAAALVVAVELARLVDP